MRETTIVVDALSVHFGGGLSFLTRQLAALGSIAGDRRLRVLSAPWNHDAIWQATGAEPELIPVRGVGSRISYEQLVLSRGSGRQVLYCPGNLIPLGPSRPPVVLALQNPNLVGAGAREAHNRGPNRRVQIAITRRSARLADRVVVISNALRDQVDEDGLAGRDRLRVIPSGCPELVGGAEATEPDGFPFAPMEYFLILANDAPHKRHDEMVAAWSRAFAGRSDAPGLVIAGEMAQPRRSRQRALAAPGLRSQLVHTGQVRDRSAVSWLLRNARALVAMSTLEAHPLTPAEAGQAGCPLVLSDIPAHREVAGAHATYVGTEDLDGLGAALRQLARSSPRAPWTWPVTWQDNAGMLLDVLDEVAP